MHSLFDQRRLSQSQSNLTFSLHACRFSFRAVDTIYFHPGKAGNILRGAFGTILQNLACHSDCFSTKDCVIRDRCPYARFFEPTAIITGPSGKKDQPRPFVLRATHLDGRIFHPGECFHFDVHLFDLQEAALQHFILAFSQLAHEGLGPSRGRAFLISTHALDASGHQSQQIYDGVDGAFPLALLPIVLSLDPAASAVRRIKIDFFTPTEIKENQRILEQPVFGSLFKRLCSRLSDLRKFYGAGSLDLDFYGIGNRADKVKLASTDIVYLEAERLAGHSRQYHPIGGFIGKAEYEGDLTEFVPFLSAGYWTGVGRQTVWGKGAIRVLDLS
jgi:hypothetical protein